MIAIVRPEAIAAIIASTNNANSGNMLTAPPREVWLGASVTTHHIDLDLGVALMIDTIFIGSTNAASGATITVSRGTGMGAGLTGGRPTDTRTDAQAAALAAVLKEWRQRFPDAKIRGHRDLSPDLNRDGRITSNEWLKDCPCFDVRDWCHTVGIDPK